MKVNLARSRSCGDGVDPRAGRDKGVLIDFCFGMKMKPNVFSKSENDFMFVLRFSRAQSYAAELNH